MRLFFIGVLLSTWAHGWTLNNNFAASFKNSRVKVFVDDSTVCPSNKIDPYELESLVGPAVDQFWNEVPTSSLRLEHAGFSPHIDTINQGRLCSPTDEKCITDGMAAGDNDAKKGLIPAVNDIIIACNSNALNFGSGNVLAVTIPNNFSSKKIKGSVILINDASDAFKSLDRDDQIAVIAHEIGHAIGLGHSKDNAALMYYRTKDLQTHLGQDDMDGVSFLYPMHGDIFGLSDEGILGGCGTISTDDDNHPGGNHPYLFMGIAFGLLVLVFEMMRWLKRAKARSAF